MSRVDPIHPIDDEERITALEAKRARIVEAPWHLNAEAIRERRWLVVPVEKGRHFEPEDAVRVARAITQRGLDTCFAVATEPVGPEPTCYRVAAVPDAFLAISRVFAGLNFVLLPDDESWAILCTSEDYNLYAGDRRFVETCVGTSIDDARRAFIDIASDDWWEGRLLSVARRYDG